MLTEKIPDSQRPAGVELGDVSEARPPRPVPGAIKVVRATTDAPDTAAGDASARVARAVHENERRFDQLVLLTGARRTALLLVVLGVAGSSIGAAAMRGTRSRPPGAGSQSPPHAEHP